ncbi:MAG: hypothetical protein Q9185_006354 [Variospora sp. 1 TL-2023]
MDPLARDSDTTPSSDPLPTAETPLLPRYRPPRPPSVTSPSLYACVGQDLAIDVAHDPLPSANADATPTRNPASSQVEHDAKRHLFLRTVLLCGFLSLVADLGGNMTAAPEIRILELSLCREYYRAHDPSVIGLPPWRFVDERYCKIAEVQSQLAQLRGLRAPLSVIPGLLFTVFAGSLADIYGRKPLLLCSFTGIFLSYLWPCVVCWFYGTFSASWVLASPLFLCIGGGTQVLAALLISIIVDVTPPHLRTATIYMINSAELITEFVSPPIGAALMRTNVWLAFAVSIPVILLSYPVIAAIPETLAPTVRPADGGPSRASSKSDYERRALTKVLHRLRGHSSELFRKALALVKVPSVALSLAIYLLDAWAVQSSSLLLQFASERLHWSLGHSAYLLSIRAAVALLLTLVILPVLNQFLFRSLQVQPFKIDAVVLRVSFLASCLGYLLIGGSNSQGLLILGCIISSSGSNAPQTLQGLVSSFTDGFNTAELYSTLAFAQLVGTMLGGPTAAALFTLGLRLGPGTPWAGLPFFASSVSSTRFPVPKHYACLDKLTQ